MQQLLIITILFIFFSFSQSSMAKKRCKPLLNKLHNVQSLQRQSHSAQKGASLRKREDKARSLWWQCENSTKKTKNSTQKKKKNSSQSATNQGRPKQKKIISAKDPFITNQAIVIKSKYQGKKKQAWLNYYLQPKRCIKPKSLSEFAYCSENKQIQRTSFEKVYVEILN